MRKAAIGLLVLMLAGGCAKKASNSTNQAPDFDLKDLAGNHVTLQQFRGHPVFLDFWATWCPPCLIAGPYVEKLYELHKKDGLVVLGMNVDDGPGPVYAYAKKMNIPYPILFAGDSSVPAQYRIEGFPSFIFIDAQGRAVQLFEGFSPDMPDAWEAEFQRLRAKTQ